jgi:hypothetical protein
VTVQIRIDRIDGVFAVDQLFGAAPGAAHGRDLNEPLPSDTCASPEGRLCIDSDWRGLQTRTAVHALLILDDAHLHLAAWMPGPPWAFPDAVPGRFRPGLWQRDVVELFLCDGEGDGYREYHLSPGGEWWMGCFSAPRVGAGEVALPRQPSMPASEPVAGTPENDRRPEDSADFRAPTVFVSAETTGAGWKGVLSIPRDLLSPGFAQACDAGSRSAGATGLSANVAAIVGGQDRRFLSASPLPGGRPDFHQPRSFARVFVSPLR